MTQPAITVHYLANHPALSDKLAQLSWAEWQYVYEERGQDFNDALKSYRERTNTGSLPLALVAFEGEQLVGTVSLKHQDLDTRPEITPWLGGLFVIPEWRRRGVASLLMRRATQEARRLSLDTLFLWTSSAESLYLKLGWRPVERMEYYVKRIVIMQIDVTACD